MEFDQVRPLFGTRHAYYRVVKSKWSFCRQFSKGMFMLVLSRKQNQEIVIGDNIKITVLKIKGNTIRLGIDAPRDVKVVRGELSFDSDIELKEEECEANVTIVFSNDPASPQPNVDVIPIRQDGVKNAEIPKPRIDSDSESKGDFESYSFQAQLPKTLQNNRLKELVKQITRNRE